jgi:glycosyltransferase involved in cell wall biosynthesis
MDRIRTAVVGLRGFEEGLGGVETAVRETSARLVEMGVDVTCFCRPRYNQLSDYHGIRLVNIPAPASKHMETAVYAMRALWRASIEDFDIIHIHALPSALVAWIPVFFSSKKVIVTIHGLDWQREKWGGAASALLLRGEWCAVKLPHCTVCVSECLRRHLGRKYPNRHLEYIPNGCESPPEGSRDGGYVLSMGRLVPEKGVHFLIEAFEKIDTPARLIIAGGETHEGAYMRRLRQMAEQDQRIELVGPVIGEKKQKLLSRAAVFTLPSTLEGQPVALMEACAAGICPAVSRIPETLEILGPAAEEGANLFDPRSPDTIASSLRYLLENPDQSARLGRVAREYVTETYSWDRTARMTLDLYCRLLGIHERAGTTCT